MAPFNPEIKPVNESYINRSQGISVPDNIKPTGQQTNQIMPRGVAEGNRAAEYAGKAEATGYQLDANDFDTRATLVNGITQATKYGVGITDELIKKGIEKDVYDQVNQEREGYLQELQAFKTKLEGSGNLKSFLDANAQAIEDLPDELQEFTETTDRLAAARQQGATPGRQRASGYATKLVQVAKNLRSKYPGYTDYVDQRMEMVSGHKPANYMMAQMLGDINDKMTGQNANIKRTLSFATSKENLGFLSLTGRSDEIIQGIMAGQIQLPDIVKMIAPYAQRRTQNELLKFQREDIDNKRALTNDLQGLAVDEVDGRVSTMAGEAVDKFQVQVLGVKDPMKFVEFARAASNGQFSPQQREAVGQQLVMQLPYIRQEMLAEGKKRNPKTGRTLIQDAGGMEKFTKKVDESLQTFNAYKDAFYSGQFGTVGALSREMSAQSDMMKARLLNHPDMGPTLQILEGMRKIGGDSNIMNEFYLEMFRKGMDQKVQKFAGDYAGEFMAGTAAAKTGKHVTFNDFLTYAQKNKVATNETVSTVFEHTMARLKDSKISPDIKYNLIQSMYGDGNLNFVEKLNKDGVDSKGRPILGTFYTYNQMTAPEVTEMIKELDKAKPGVWNKYVNWATTTYRNLFVRELKDFESSYDTLKGRGITVDWIKSTGEFKPKFALTSSNESRPAEYGMRDTYSTTKDKVTSQFQKLNDGLKGLRAIAVGAGKSPDEVEAFMLDTMANAGWRPSADIGGLPEKMMQKLIGAKMAEEANKTARKKIEDEQGKR